MGYTAEVGLSAHKKMFVFVTSRALRPSSNFSQHNQPPNNTPPPTIKHYLVVVMQPPLPPPPQHPPPWHSLTAGIFGVYCTSCNQRVKQRGNLLFPPDSKTIRLHLKNHGCYDGAKLPNAVKIESELITSQDALHFAVKDKPQLAAEKIELVFPPRTIVQYNAHICNKCGYTSKNKKVFQSHFREGNEYGCQYFTDASRGEVCQGKYGITCPKHFLTAVVAGTFVRPNKRLRSNPKHNMPNRGAPSSTAVNNINASPQQQPPPTNTSTPQSTQYQPILTTSPSTLSRAKEGTPLNQLNVNSEARINHALQVFVDPSSTNAGDST